MLFMLRIKKRLRLHLSWESFLLIAININLTKAEEKAAEINLILERNLSMLSTIASISPLLGLLGTVVGMITVFGNIDINGSANADLLAAGISEALITTAFGLIIAVPAIVFYRYFEQKILNLMSILQANTSLFLDFIYKK
jgi:biopolymer transport protein ExbB